MSSGLPKTPTRGTSAESTASSTDKREEISELQDLFENYAKNPDQLLKNSTDQIKGLCSRVSSLLKDKENYPADRKSYELNPDQSLTNNAQLLSNSLYYCTKNPGGILRYAAQGTKYNQEYKAQKPTEILQFIKPSDSCSTLEAARQTLIQEIEDRPFHIPLLTKTFLTELQPWINTTKLYITDRDLKITVLREENDSLRTEITTQGQQIDDGNLIVKSLEARLSTLKNQLKGEEETSTQLQKLNEQKDLAYETLGKTHRRTKSLLEESQAQLQQLQTPAASQEPETPQRHPTSLKPGRSPRTISSPSPIPLRQDSSPLDLSHLHGKRIGRGRSDNPPRDDPSFIPQEEPYEERDNRRNARLKYGGEAYDLLTPTQKEEVNQDYYQSQQ